MSNQMSSKKLLSQFGRQPTRRTSFLDEFMQVGDKAYGISMPNQKLSTYGTSGYTRVNPLDIDEYFGTVKASKGANIDKEKVKVPVKRQDAVNKFYQNNNPGSIKKGTFGGQTWGGETYAGKLTGIEYRKYNSKEEGLVDIINVIKNYETNDLKRIISKYASDDASGKVYANYYEDLKKVLPEKLDFNNDEQMKNLMKVITITENKGNSVPPGLYYKEKDFDNALKLYNKIKDTKTETVYPIKKPDEVITIPERKPFRFGGGADASKSDFGGGGSSSSSSGGDSNKGGNKGGGQDASQPDFGGFKKDSNKGGGADASQPDYSNQNTTINNINSSTKKVKKVTDVVKNQLFNIGYDFVDDFTNPTFNPEMTQMINQQVLKSFQTPVGDLSITRTTTRDLPLDKQGLLNPDTEYGANIKGSYKGVDYGASIDDTGDIAGGFTTDIGNVNVTGKGTYDGSDDYGFSVKAKVSFKKGGLLDRSHKK